MNYRMSRRVALMGALLSLSFFAHVALAQECEEVSLYNGSSSAGQMADGSTFPEAPEWAANWGDLDGMTPPYIRLSGLKNSAGDWSGEMSFATMPVTVKGDNLKLKLRSTQAGKASLWLAGSFGKSSAYSMDLLANKTYDVNVPVTAFNIGNGATVSRLGFGLLNVPANQYTTLLVDDVAVTCGSSVGSSGSTSSVGDASDETDAESDTVMFYPYSDIKPESPVRDTKFLDTPASASSAEYSQEEREQISDSTSLKFVVGMLDEIRMERFLATQEHTPEESYDWWYDATFTLDANRLKDSVIVNPAQLLYEAEAYTASSDKKAMPLLISNVDYGYRVCTDSLCESQTILPNRLLIAGLPTSKVNGSEFTIFYDPYFVATNRTELPTVEIKNSDAWVKFTPKTQMKIQFEGAGTQKFQVRLTEGGVTTTQTLYVEVK